MTDENGYSRRGVRRHKTMVKSMRQARIAKSAGLPVRDIHRYAKHHALDCGNPQCALCTNPRKYGELTIQEQRFLQKRLYLEDLIDDEITYRLANDENSHVPV